MRDLVGSFDHPGSRGEAYFPAVTLGIDEYWPPVSLVEDDPGDRGLVCHCPPLEGYA